MQRNGGGGVSRELSLIPYGIYQIKWIILQHAKLKKNFIKYIQPWV